MLSQYQTYRGFAHTCHLLSSAQLFMHCASISGQRGSSEGSSVLGGPALQPLVSHAASTAAWQMQAMGSSSIRPALLASKNMLHLVLQKLCVQQILAGITGSRASQYPQTADPCSTHDPHGCHLHWAYLAKGLLAILRNLGKCIAAEHCCMQVSSGSEWYHAWACMSTRAEDQPLTRCREFSRQQYLVKREDKKLEELEADVQDAEMLFEGEKLTAKELGEIRYRKQVLELAKMRKKAQEDLDRDDGYHMPTAYDKEGAAPSERYKVLTERYRCAA